MKASAKEEQFTSFKNSTERLEEAISIVRELGGQEIARLEVYLKKSQDTKPMRDARNAIERLPEGIKKTLRELFDALSCALYPPTFDGDERDANKVNDTYEALYSVIDPAWYPGALYLDETEEGEMAGLEAGTATRAE
jgi:hypothetical protein